MKEQGTMRSILKKEFNIPARWLLVIIFVLLIAGSLYYAYIFKESTKDLYLSILVGISTGFTIALVQFLLAWREQKQIDIFEGMGVINVLPARDNRKIYGDIIRNTSERLWVMGNTATRLLQHFAVEGHTSNEDEKVLLNILDKGVDVKILIAKKTKLTRDSDKEIFSSTKKRLENLKSTYDNFDFKYYNHDPNHSIFVFDNECFLGSIFENLPSKETPVIRMKTNSEFATKYIDAFKYEWEKAS